MRAPRAIAAAVGGNLKLKFALFILAILGLALGLAPWSAIKTQERQLLATSGERLLVLSDMLMRAIVTTCTLTGNRDSVQQVVEAVRDHGGIENVRLLDPRGVILYSSRAAERGSSLSTAELSRFYGKADPILLSQEGGRVVHTLSRPMFNAEACQACHSADQKVLGILQVTLPLDKASEQLDTLRRSAFVATLITVGVVLLGVWLSLTYLVDWPLQHLVDVMRRAEHGDLGARANVRNNDELGQLARRFNEMISRLQGAQQELEQYHRQQLARADRLATIGEMAAVMAHEIRNPLTGISGALTVLSRQFPADDSRREIVRQMRLLIERLNKSVEDILHYSRPSAPQLQAVKLDDIVDRTLSLLEGEMRKARIQIVRTDAGTAGDGGAPAVTADPHQIQQVLTNLILNAIQASAGGGPIRIRTFVTRNNGGREHVCVEIEDNGKGMTADEVAKAFHPFFSTRAQGTGLGLPIAKQIVEQHQGRLSLRSAVGRGTCAAVELPVDAPSAGEGT